MKKLFLLSALALSMSAAWGQSGTGDAPTKINLSESRLTACAGSEITLVAAAGCSFGKPQCRYHLLGAQNRHDRLQGYHRQHDDLFYRYRCIQLYCYRYL
ncbi:MAG: hypothetical protein LBD91_06000 [Prevotellaceae bacterium]|nr:hypothetical protein [Prevotellaceae bacterium]